MADCTNCHRFDFAPFGAQVDTIQFLEVLVSELYAVNVYVPKRETWCVACWDAAKTRGGEWVEHGRTFRGDISLRVSLLGVA